MIVIRSLLIASSVAALTLAIADPVSAGSTGPTTTTLTVVGGVISITVPASVSLGSRTNTVGGGTLSAPLGQVQVSDARSAAAGSSWAATVISTAFTPSSGPTIGAANVGYTVGTISKIGTATYNSHDAADLSGSVNVVSATGITGDNSATWNPEINVLIPGGVAAGTYSAMITHSVA